MYECPNCQAPLRTVRSGGEVIGYKCDECWEVFSEDDQAREAYVAWRIEEHEARGDTNYNVGDFYEEYATRTFGAAQ